ncbi:glycosyl transferase [[Phormidium] sp. ETS-05]|uniref:glycosyl transferase n=1 Tax=[Phormidium] sp. ETS-05 TaxID=222819 RepID=UPI0018EEDE98|nr:glycosyl transferase [[Phormidium] sp. ETS-05]
MVKKSPVLYVAITNHGFGHAVRAASVAGVLRQLYPDITLIVTTTAPRWLLANYIPGDFIQRDRAFDCGVIQRDSLQMDLDATFAKLRQIRDNQQEIIAEEANFIRDSGVGLILADIPPLIAPIAAAAGVPCWMMSNFGWDFIYRPWGGEFTEIADWIGECFSQCDLLFRLPFHEPMSAFSRITDVGLTGGKPRYSNEEMRSKWGLTAPKEKTILLSFGGLGLEQIPYHNLARFPDWQFISFDDNAPQLSNLITVTGRDYRPVDFMPLCDRVISKPGFSTFSEACRLEVPIVSLTREGFAESPLLLEGIRNFARHQIITQEEFFQGGWEFLDQEMSPPQTTATLPKDGTEVIAQAVVDYFENLSS